MAKCKSTADIFCKWKAKNGRRYTARLSGRNHKQVDSFNHGSRSGQNARIRRVKQLELNTDFVVFHGTVKQFLKEQKNA